MHFDIRQRQVKHSCKLILHKYALQSEFFSHILRIQFPYVRVIRVRSGYGFLQKYFLRVLLHKSR